MIMKKIGIHSHFAVVSENDLRLYGDRVLQIDSEPIGEGSWGFPVFICEVSDEKRGDYE